MASAFFSASFLSLGKLLHTAGIRFCIPPGGADAKPLCPGGAENSPTCPGGGGGGNTPVCPGGGGAGNTPVCPGGGGGGNTPWASTLPGSAATAATASTAASLRFMQFFPVPGTNPTIRPAYGALNSATWGQNASNP